MGHVEGGEIGYGGAIGGFAFCDGKGVRGGGDLAGAGVVVVQFERVCGDLEVVKEASKNTHLGFEFVNFFGNEYELCAVYKDVFLEIL